jgi:hypothetical protein
MFEECLQNFKWAVSKATSLTQKVEDIYYRYELNSGFSIC